MIVAGVDGCKAGWVVALVDDAKAGLSVRLVVAKDFSAVLGLTKTCDAVAVDIPIGLADSQKRACDAEARALLRGGSSSVFSSPVRAVLEAKSIEQANRISRRVAGFGTPAQTFALVPKILEVDNLMTPKLQKRVFEVHPEVCFSQALNGGRTLGFGKKSAIGALSRLRLLQEVGLDASAALATWRVSGRPAVEGKVGLDDVLDALAAAWTARRQARGEAQRVAKQEERDAKGLLMQMIW